MPNKRVQLVEFRTQCGCSRIEEMAIDWPPPDRLRRNRYRPVTFTEEPDLRTALLLGWERWFVLDGRTKNTIVYREE